MVSYRKFDIPNGINIYTIIIFMRLPIPNSIPSVTQLNLLLFRWMIQSTFFLLILLLSFQKSITSESVKQYTCLSLSLLPLALSSNQKSPSDSPMT